MGWEGQPVHIRRLRPAPSLWAVLIRPSGRGTGRPCPVLAIGERARSCPAGRPRTKAIGPGAESEQEPGSIEPGKDRTASDGRGRIGSRVICEVVQGVGRRQPKGFYRAFQDPAWGLAPRGLVLGGACRMRGGTCGQARQVALHRTRRTSGHDTQNENNRLRRGLAVMQWGLGAGGEGKAGGRRRAAPRD